MKEEHKEFLAQYGSEEHLDELVDKGDWWDREAIALNPFATKEHLSKLVNDSNDDVKIAARQKPRNTD